VNPEKTKREEGGHERGREIGGRRRERQREGQGRGREDRWSYR
jgi:hypothetical protein